MSQLKDQAAFVTGATGFLGGALVHRLVAEGMQVKALARDLTRAAYIRDLPAVEIVRGDITDARVMTDLIRDVDVVFHVAAATSGPLSLQTRVNVNGTRNVAQASANAGAKRLVHVSSIAVYGYQYRGVITEDTPHLPGRTAYSVTKSQAESEVQRVAVETGLAYSIIRPGMIYGERSGAWTVSMYRLATIDPTPFIGAGAGTAYPIYVGDVVDMMVLLATHPDAIGEAFNCVMPDLPTFREFIGYYQAMAGHQNWLSIPPRAVQTVAPLLEITRRFRDDPVDLSDLVTYIESSVSYSMDKAQHQLDWQPPTSLDVGMARSAAYLIEQGLL